MNESGCFQDCLKENQNNLPDKQKERQLTFQEERFDIKIGVPYMDRRKTQKSEY